MTGGKHARVTAALLRWRLVPSSFDLWGIRLVFGVDAGYVLTARTKSASSPYAVGSGPATIPSRSDSMTQ